MMNRILSLLGIADQNQDTIDASRRRHMRFAGGAEVFMTIDERAFPVKDWSQGGFMFDANDNINLTQGDEIRFTLHFDLPHERIALAHKGQVIRSQRKGVATEFAPLTKEARRLISRAIDSANAEGFSQSQVSNA